MRTTILALLSLLSAALLISPASMAAPAPARAPALPADYLRVPLVRQATDYSCGPASLLGTIYYWQAGNIGESELYKIAGTTQADGTSYRDLGAGAALYGKAYGLTAETRDHLTTADLRGYLAQGTPVILDIQAWRGPKTQDLPWADDWEDGHFVVLVALDADYAYFMDPSAAAGYAYMPLAELDERWHDYDMVNGKKVVADHAGVAVRGAQGLTTNPGPLVRVE
jgi:predicted double-glycine peptidase